VSDGVFPTDVFTAFVANQQSSAAMSFFAVTKSKKVLFLLLAALSNLT